MSYDCKSPWVALRLRRWLSRYQSCYTIMRTKVGILRTHIEATWAQCSIYNSGTQVETRNPQSKLASQKAKTASLRLSEELCLNRLGGKQLVPDGRLTSAYKCVHMHVHIHLHPHTCEHVAHTYHIYICPTYQKSSSVTAMQSFISSFCLVNLELCLSTSLTWGRKSRTTQVLAKKSKFIHIFKITVLQANKKVRLKIRQVTLEQLLEAAYLLI